MYKCMCLIKKGNQKLTNTCLTRVFFYWLFIYLRKQDARFDLKLKISTAGSNFHHTSYNINCWVHCVFISVVCEADLELCLVPHNPLFSVLHLTGSYYCTKVDSLSHTKKTLPPKKSLKMSIYVCFKATCMLTVSLLSNSFISWIYQ